MYQRAAFRRVLEERLDEKRLRHSLAVERMAIRLAAAHGEDWYRAGIAGLLHDVCKCDDELWQLDYMGKNGIKLDAAWLGNPQLWHGPCASVFLRRELRIRDRDILRAVRYHTTGRPGMTKLEKIICLADGISDERRYPGVVQARDVAFRNLDEGLALGLGAGIESAIKKGLPLVRECTMAYNECLEAQSHGLSADRMDSFHP